MAGDWIKMRKGLRTKVPVVQIATATLDRHFSSDGQAFARWFDSACCY